jgi:hypothetical protein
MTVCHPMAKGTGGRRPGYINPVLKVYLDKMELKTFPDAEGSKGLGRLVSVPYSTQ